ncbi:adenine phosphoribosyltransferase [bacterium]|nr:adenine phosphoribosyltransferase [bacterium]MBU1073307.1 adenine phosphoribosyltransferase [bacterium]MBU1676973.1 adenine phosphoribosyltransferase [bacterium]
MDLKTVIRDVPDFPQPGILFRDITPVLERPDAFRAALDGLADLISATAFDKIAALESRGFIFAAPLARQLGKPLIILRKPGKLPGRTVSVAYDLEYGSAALEAHDDSLSAGDKVLIVDDLLATGGTAAAAQLLVTRLGATVAAQLFLVELEDLEGRSRLAGTPVFSLVKYSGDG